MDPRRSPACQMAAGVRHLHIAEVRDVTNGHNRNIMYAFDEFK